MKTVAAVLLAVVLVGLVLIPVQRNNVQEMEEPHPSVTSLDSEIPRINYIEQTRDLRRTMEKHPQVMTIRHNQRDRSHFIEHEIVVRFSPPLKDAELQKLLKQVNGRVKRKNGDSMIIASRKMTSKQMMKVLAEHPDSIYAEPNYILLPNRVPNDTLYRRYQWNLPIIGMEEGWEISQGSSQVVVAVIDTGVDLRHPEFRGKLVDGYNVIADNNQPQDDNGHGTHVAGIISARTNNGNGIAGMSWNSKIMPVKAIGANGSGTAFDIAQGIQWATDHGADVINLSVGNYTPSAALRDACRYAYEHNVVLVAATGNDATSQPGYPAAYPEVLGVSAIDHRTQLARFSNYGDYVDVVAPGVDIASTYIYNDYAALSGTSMACPHAAALAALVRSVQPAMKSADVMKLIRDSSVDLGSPGRDNWYGYGMINSGEALRRIGEPQVTRERNDTFVGNLIEKLFSRLRIGFNQQ
ncbi:S8 family peptidase [Brevibacillus humidisoli]|uniref:S8 family peptidase n=1 Tax=Brevibacillus humidisoli TaxID=2895522 RepID=UPI001E2E3748|nr:S8 family peptidase [Brevibacillus humidisoli]UFJ43096.1 S8 family peptidase [Brevibacillus humidisoli]